LNLFSICFFFLVFYEYFEKYWEFSTFVFLKYQLDFTFSTINHSQTLLSKNFPYRKKRVHFKINKKTTHHCRTNTFIISKQDLCFLRKRNLTFLCNTFFWLNIGYTLLRISALSISKERLIVSLLFVETRSPSLNNLYNLNCSSYF